MVDHEEPISPIERVEPYVMELQIKSPSVLSKTLERPKEPVTPVEEFTFVSCNLNSIELTVLQKTDEQPSVKKFDLKTLSKLESLKIDGSIFEWYGNDSDFQATKLINQLN